MSKDENDEFEKEMMGNLRMLMMLNLASIIQKDLKRLKQWEQEQGQIT